MTEYNPYYFAYAASNGMTPEAMLEHDECRWPGGRMAGFQIWMSNNWSTWRELNHIPKNAIISEARRQQFGESLSANSSLLTPPPEPPSEQP